MSFSSAVRSTVVLAAAASSCTAVLGIDKDYYEASGASGGAGGAGTGGGGNGTSTTSGGGDGGSGGGAPLPDSCTGSEPGVCLATFPEQEGWTGYYLLHSTNVSEGPDACPGMSPPIKLYEPTTAPATCSACTCGPASITCHAALQGWEDSTCTAGSFSNYDVTGPCTVTGVIVNGMLPGVAMSEVSCTPGVSTPTLDSVWAVEHTLCMADTLPEGICPNGEVCVQDSELKTCIKADGDAACPAGWERATRYQYYNDGGAVDNRDCDACACDPPPENLCDGGTYQIFDSASCIDPPTSTAPEGAPCVNAITSLSVRYVAPAPPGGTECTPSGGAPVGTVDPGPVAATLCCRN